MSDDQHPFDQATTVEVARHRDRLAKVAPRITYVILCWCAPPRREGTFGGSFSQQARPDAILGPFTEREAMRQAAVMTCECEVTNITTEPPGWATKAPEREAPTA